MQSETNLTHQAAELEKLLPYVMQKLFRPGENDPISELPIGQLRVVRALECREMTMSQLAEDFRMSLSAASQLVSRLVEGGLAEVVSRDDDRRVRIIRLTASCQELMRSRHGQRVQNAEAVLARMRLEERAEFMVLLRRLVEACQGLQLDPHSRELTAQLEQVI